MDKQKSIDEIISLIGNAKSDLESAINQLSGRSKKLTVEDDWSQAVREGRAIDADLVTPGVDPWAEVTRLNQIIKELHDENVRIMQDSLQVMIKKLVIENGGIDAEMSNQPFTKIIAKWAVECFKAQSEADWTPNYLTMDFGLVGEEHYTMTVQRANGELPEKLASKYKKERDNLVKAINQAYDWFMEYVDKHMKNNDYEKAQRNLDRAEFLMRSTKNMVGLSI